MQVFSTNKWMLQNILSYGNLTIPRTNSVSNDDCTPAHQCERENEVKKPVTEDKSENKVKNDHAISFRKIVVYLELIIFGK